MKSSGLLFLAAASIFTFGSCQTVITATNPTTIPVNTVISGVAPSSSPTPPGTKTTKTIQAQSPRTGPYSSVLAAEVAINYIAGMLKIPATGMQVLGVETSIPDLVSNEVTTICNVVTQSPGSIMFKVVVDPQGNPALLDKAYYDSIAQHYKDAAGSMNPDLYIYLQTASPDKLIKVEIIVDLKSDLASFIRDNGFTVTNVGDTADSRFIYAALSKEYIIELAFSMGAPYMQLEPVYVIP